MFKSDGNVIHFAAPKGMSFAFPGRARATMIWSFDSQDHRTSY